MHSTAEKERAGKQVAAEFVGKTAAEALDPVAIMAVATKQRCELNRALKLLARARKELHLIREKDSRAVYDTTVRIQSDAFLSHYLKTKGEQTVSTNVMSTSGSAERSPITPGMKLVLDTVADARSGEISGWSVAKWLNQSRNPEGVRERLRALVNRGLIVMRPVDDPPRKFPDRLKAMYSVAAPPEERKPQ